MSTVSLTLRSKNAKTGDIPVSMTDSNSCPDSCPMKAKGCYAKSGPLSWEWNKMRGMQWDSFCSAIASLPLGQFWRHNQAGDLPGIGEQIDHHALGSLVKANVGRKGFTYTHKYGTESNREAIRSANANGFTVNLSSNSLAHADTLLAMNCGPVVTLLPSDAKHGTTTPNGARVVVCPKATGKAASCDACRLCQHANRSYVIGFPAHGASKKTVEAIANS